MNNTKTEVMGILYTELNGVYCDSCRFENISQEESERIFGYYGCDDCYRKNMNWEISEKYCEVLTNKILRVIKGDNSAKD